MDSYTSVQHKRLARKLPPPPSSHSIRNPQPPISPHRTTFSSPQTRTPPVVSDPDAQNSVLSPVLTPPRSQSSTSPSTHQMPSNHVLRFPGPDPDPDLPIYYATKSSHPMTYSINNSLLHVFALITQSSADPEYSAQALKEADAALTLATQYELWDIVSKCQLFRGLCLSQMRNWKEARRAYTRAATIRSWGDAIKVALKIVEQGEEMDGEGKVSVLSDRESRARSMDYILSHVWRDG